MKKKLTVEEFRAAVDKLPTKLKPGESQFFCTRCGQALRGYAHGQLQAERDRELEKERTAKVRAMIDEALARHEQKGES